MKVQCEFIMCKHNDGMIVGQAGSCHAENIKLTWVEAEIDVEQMEVVELLNCENFEKNMNKVPTQRG